MENNKQNLENSIDNFRDLIGVLIDDLKSISNQPGDTQFWRRTLLRTIFANIESLTYAMKQVAFQISVIKSIELTKEVQETINEYYFDKNGEISKNIKKIKTKENFYYGFKILADVCGSTPLVVKGNTDWDRFIKVIRIRDRITHPKAKISLDIKDDEYKKIREVLNWYLGIIKNVVEYHLQNFRK